MKMTKEQLIRRGFCGAALVLNGVTYHCCKQSMHTGSPFPDAQEHRFVENLPRIPE